MKVKFSNPLATAITAFIAPVINEVTSFTNISDVIEHPYVKTITLEPNTGKSSGTLTLNLDFKTWYQLSIGSATGTY